VYKDDKSSIKKVDFLIQNSDKKFRDAV